MISLCAELKTSCKYCGDPLPINALEVSFRCEKCGKDNSISENTWESLLKENIREIQSFDAGEGRNSSVFTGEYQFNLMYGRQDPRCGKCKTDIPQDEIFKFKEAGNYKCASCSNAIFIRPANKFALSISSEAEYLIGEDPDQLSSGKGSIKTAQAVKPIIFKCPSCAGVLKVDGTSRIITCNFCNSDIYLPDDLWFSIHPAKIIERWYLLLNQKKVEEKLPAWEDIADADCDENGNVYVASTSNNYDEFIIWSFTPGLKNRWIRKDLKLDVNYTKIKVWKDKLFVWNSERAYISILSCGDGKDIQKIQLDSKGCYSVMPYNDGTIFFLSKDKINRVQADGTYISVWKSKEKPGLLAFFFKNFSNSLSGNSDEDDSTVFVDQLGSKPKRVSSEYTHILMGPDSSIYFYNHISSSLMIAKYDLNGTVLWKKKLTLEDSTGRPCFDQKGNIYFLGENAEGNAALLQMSGDGNNIQILLKDIVEKGILTDEKVLAVSPDGTMYCFDDDSKLKVITADLQLKYRSENSVAADKEETGE